MNKKGITSLMIGILLLAAVGFAIGGYYYLPNISLIRGAAFDEVSRCQLIDEVTYTNEAATPFVCDASKCMIWGELELERGIGETFWGCDNVPDPILYGSEPACRGDPNRGCTIQHCEELFVQKYEGFWNFCPSTDLNYDYCRQYNALVEGEGNHWIPVNEAYVLGNGASISFNPKYINNSLVTSKKLNIGRYDCSCEPAIDDEPETYCAIGSINCEEVGSGRCPNGDYVLYNDNEYVRCDSGDYDDPHRATPSSPVCHEAVSRTINAECIIPEGSRSTYQRCNEKGDSPDGGAQCDVWGSYGDCRDQNTNSICKTSEVGNDYCGYPDDACGQNEREKVGDRTYQECELKSGDFYGWSSTRTCGGTLVFDESVQNIHNTYGDCVCPTGGTECTYLESTAPTICMSPSSYSDCTFYSNGGKDCYHEISNSCEGLETCNNGQCGCLNQVCDSVNDISCNGRENYYKCLIKPGEVCFSWDSSSTSVSSNQECVGDILVQKEGCTYSQDTNQGCLNWEGCNNIGDGSCICESGLSLEQSCGTSNQICLNNKCESYGCGPGYYGLTCDTDYETCTNHQCVLIQDRFSATSQDYLNGVTKCFEDNVYGVNEYTSSNGIKAYRWEVEDSCGELICAGEEL